MDIDKDIGLICDLYSNKDETQIVNKNEIVNPNDSKISDVENSITSSLINKNNNTPLLICDNRIIVCFKLTTVIIFFVVLVFGMYFVINKYL